MKVERTDYFNQNVNFYFRKKKYRKITDDIDPIIKELEQGNLPGDKIPGLHLPEGTAAYKVRISNSSANVGKSNGFRLIYYVVIDKKVYLLTIYSKKDDERIPDDSGIIDFISPLLKNLN